MNQRNVPRLRHFRQIAIATVLGIALVGLTQCRNVTEPLTGVDLRTPGTLSARSNCQRHCNDQFKAGLLAEEIRYKQARRACGADQECKKEEERKHATILRDLLQTKRVCKRSCYNEGAGAGV